MEALNQEETACYIHHRIEVAGGDGTLIFNAAACDAVYRHSRGIPRLINLVCDTALVYGFAEQKRQIDAQMVDDVARDKRKGGLFPSQRKDEQPSRAEPPPSTVSGQPASPLAHGHYAGGAELTYQATDPENATPRRTEGGK